MRALSNSYSSLNTTAITNPYQQDKEQLNSYINQMKKSIEKGDFDNAKSLLEESNKLIGSNDSKRRSGRISQQQDELKKQLNTLSDFINKKDGGSALEIISSIKDELKTNKNLILKSHNSSEIVSELRSKYLLSIYA